MSEETIKTLKKFKDVNPDEDFAKRSLTLILHSPQKQPLFFFKNFFNAFEYSGALVLASVLIFVVFGGLSMLRSNLLAPASLSGLNPDNLQEELEGMDLKIKLAEVHYYEGPTSAQEVARAQNSDPSDSFNAESLETEKENLEKFDSDNKSVEELLNTLVL